MVPPGDTVSYGASSVWPYSVVGWKYRTGDTTSTPLGPGGWDSVTSSGDTIWQGRVVHPGIVIVTGTRDPSCDYPPLNEWMIQTLRGFHARGEVGPAAAFARILEPDIPVAMQQALLEAAEDPSFA